MTRLGKEVRGLTADLYRSSLSDSSNGGISSTVDEVTIVGPEIDAAHGNIFPPSEDAPAVRIVKLTIMGHEYVHLEPVEPVPAGHVGYVAGGTFVYTPDSRFREATGVHYPVPLCDRTDTLEQYRVLST